MHLLVNRPILPQGSGGEQSTIVVALPLVGVDEIWNVPEQYAVSMRKVELVHK